MTIKGINPIRVANQSPAIMFAAMFKLTTQATTAATPANLLPATVSTSQKTETSENRLTFLPPNERPSDTLNFNGAHQADSSSDDDLLTDLSIFDSNPSPGSTLEIHSGNLPVPPILLNGFWTAELFDNQGKVKPEFDKEISAFATLLKSLSIVQSSGVLPNENMTDTSFALAYICKTIFCPDMSAGEFVGMIREGQKALYEGGAVSDNAMLGMQWCTHFSGDGMYERGSKRLLFDKKDQAALWKLNRRIALKSTAAWSTHSLGLGASQKGLGSRHDFVGDHAGKSPFALESSLYITAFKTGEDRKAVKEEVNGIRKKPYLELENDKQKHVWGLAHNRLTKEAFFAEMKDFMEAAGDHVESLTSENLDAIYDTICSPKGPLDNKGRLRDHAQVVDRFGIDIPFLYNDNPLKTDAVETALSHIFNRFFRAGKEETMVNAVLKQAEYSGKEMHLFCKDEQYGQQDPIHKKIHNNPLRQMGGFKKLFKKEETKQSPLRYVKPDMLEDLQAIQKKPGQVKQKEHMSELRKVVKETAFSEDEKESKKIFGLLKECGLLQLKLGSKSKYVVNSNIPVMQLTVDELRELLPLELKSKPKEVLLDLLKTLRSKVSVRERIIDLFNRRIRTDASLKEQTITAGSKFRFQVAEKKFHEVALKQGGEVQSIGFVLRAIRAGLNVDFDTKINTNIATFLDDIEKGEYTRTDVKFNELFSSMKTSLYRDVKAYVEIILQLQVLQPGVHPLEGVYEGVEKSMVLTQAQTPS